MSGRHGQAIFASHGHLVLVDELPEPPARDAARFTRLPDVLPLVVQHAPDIPYTAAAVHRVAHADTGAPEEVEVDFQAGRWPSSKVSPGVRHHRRGPADQWPRGAARIAGELAELAYGSDAEAIVVSGTPWARNVLVNRLPRPLRERVVAVPGDGRGTGPGRALMERELDEALRGRLSARDRARMETFLAQRARGGGAVEGMADVVAALQRGQVSALLLNTPVQFWGPLWTGSQPTEIALSPAELESFGVLGFQEGPAGAALIRALVRTGAELVVVPRTELPLVEGVGVLLRYTDPDTRS
ncbi:hypothetical protein [Streptomyces sp. XD-27]|uniref:baeRF2 domain-containing protein n=1 Tax=Streptomyces sp. XD-27 TaxID=3062779 RepID=UPI0026F435FF|nr:hypothetical protein [Streptomyces sp. XD-27]WKX69153.1 hypothetical protein Q3Y56_03755 [Streptomyces sp. XD-27]